MKKKSKANGFQIYTVFQPAFKYFTITTAVDKTLAWNSSGFWEEDDKSLYYIR